MRKVARYLLAAVLASGALVYGAYVFTPWPKLFLIRYAFESDAEARSKALEKYVPAGIHSELNVPYGKGADETLDIFFPKDAAGGKLPTVVWIHGGAFLAGNKSDVANYLRILAGRGYITVSVGYSIAPRARYPTPVLQANRALDFITRNPGGYPFDTDRIVLAGDSAGGQIAAQLAAAISDPNYAAQIGFTPAAPRERLRGAVLMCGVYDTDGIDIDGPFADLLQTTVWAYFGAVNTSDDPRLAQFSVRRNVTAAFPPAFISAGNGDPLAPQSAALARTLVEKGVQTDTLFFPADHKPPQPHEYHFDLDTKEGRSALERITEFLKRQTGN